MGRKPFPQMNKGCKCTKAIHPSPIIGELVNGIRTAGFQWFLIT